MQSYTRIGMIQYYSMITAQENAMARIFGSAHWGDGSEMNGTVAITTSWNSNRTSPRNGHYSLDLGGDPNQKVTVYVNGSTCATITVSGDTRLNIRG